MLFWRNNGFCERPVKPGCLRPYNSGDPARVLLDATCMDLKLPAVLPAAGDAGLEELALVNCLCES